MDAAARAELFRFVAACYYEPGPEFSEEDVFGSMLAAARRIDPELAAHASRLGVGFEAEGPERLLVDYTRLFMGPHGAAAQPYESFWVEDPPVLMGEAARSVMEAYGAGGFEIDGRFQDLPDHIACELEFLYLLLFREIQARENGDSEATDAVRELRKRFLDEHLGAWIRPFTTAMSAGARSAFYRELAALTECLVRQEAERAAAAS